MAEIYEVARPENAIVIADTGELIPIFISDDNGIVLNPVAKDIIKATYAIKKDIDDKYKNFTDGIKGAMEELFEEYGVKPKIETDDFIINYRPAGTTMRLDSKELKQLYPDEYEECLKPSHTSSSITFRAKKKKEEKNV